MEFPSSRSILPHRNPNPKGARSLSLLPQTKLRQSSSHEDEQYRTPAEESHKASCGSPSSLWSWALSARCLSCRAACCPGLTPGTSSQKCQTKP